MNTNTLSILYEDKNLIIADKGTNTIVHGARDEDTLLTRVEAHLSGVSGEKIPFLAPSNRLDRNTCGPVVFAKNRETARKMRRLFAQCRVQKTYSAQLTGRLENPLFIQADILIGRHRRARVENLEVISRDFPDKSEWFSSGNLRSGTISGTMITPVRQNDETTIVEVHPWTGRYHQIRVICQSIGYPVYGDKKYNRVPGMRRPTKKRAKWTLPMLICRKLEIPDLGIVVETRFGLEELMAVEIPGLGSDR